MKVYIAGPDVFYPNASELAQRAHQECAKRGMTALCPVDNAITPAQPHEMSHSIFAANIKMIQDADAVCANIEPFRGPSADAGTVWEIGYAFGLGKPIVAYTTDSRDYKGRVLEGKKALEGASEGAAQSGTRATSSPVDPCASSVQPSLDPNGCMVEDFGGIDNLMITHALKSVYANIESALDALSNTNG